MWTKVTTYIYLLCAIVYCLIGVQLVRQYGILIASLYPGYTILVGSILWKGVGEFKRPDAKHYYEDENNE